MCSRVTARRSQWVESGTQSGHCKSRRIRHVRQYTRMRCNIKRRGVKLSAKAYRLPSIVSLYSPGPVGGSPSLMRHSSWPRTGSHEKRGPAYGARGTERSTLGGPPQRGRTSGIRTPSHSLSDRKTGTNPITTGRGLPSSSAQQKITLIKVKCK